MKLVSNNSGKSTKLDEPYYPAPYKPEPDETPFTKLVLDITRASPKSSPAACHAAALSMIAGVAGRKLRIKGSTTNIFILVLGESGAGKSVVFSAAQEVCGAYDDDRVNMLAPQKPVSRPGLIKQLQEDPCQAIYFDELGKELALMTNKRGDQNQAALGTAFLELFSSKRFAGSSYSNKNDNVPAIEYPALTVCGSCTPNAWDKISEDSFSDGTIARFIVVSAGQKSDTWLNRYPAATRNVHFDDFVRRLDSVPEQIPMSMTQTADNILWAYEAIDVRGVGNRMPLVAYRIAALLAYYNHGGPIDDAEATYAVNLAKYSQAALERAEYEGTGGHLMSERQETALKMIVRKTKQKGHATWRELSTELRQRKAFRLDRDQAEKLTIIMRRTLKELVDMNMAQWDAAADIYTAYDQPHSVG